MPMPKVLAASLKSAYSRYLNECTRTTDRYRTVGRNREFDELKVVDLAMNTFWDRGYRATSIDDLVVATGLQRGSIYNAFGDKHGLFMVALDRYADHGLQRISAILSSGGSSLGGIYELIRTAGRECMAPDGEARGCLIGNSCGEFRTSNEEVRARLERFMIEMRGILADAVRQAQQEGEMSPERDPDSVAVFIQCGLQGMSLLSKVRPDGVVVESAVNELLGALS